MAVVVVVGFQMITRDWVWLITCLQGTEVCAFASVFTGMGLLACRYMLIRQKRQRGLMCASLPVLLWKKLQNWIRWLMSLTNRHWNQVKVLNWTCLCENSHTHAHASSGKIWHIRHDFFSCLACKKPLMVKRRRVSKKHEIWSLRLFFSLLYILPSAYLTVNETPSH